MHTELPVCGQYIRLVSFGEAVPAVAVSAARPQPPAAFRCLAHEMERDVRQEQARHSNYGVSLLEPFVVLLAQREVFDRAVEDGENLPHGGAGDRPTANQVSAFSQKPVPMAARCTGGEHLLLVADGAALVGRDARRVADLRRTPPPA